MSVQLPPGRYYGETLRNRKIASFELSERVYSPGYQTPKHTHNQALFCFVMQGHYTESYGGKTRECTSSTLLFHPPGELHAEHFHEVGGRSFIVEIAPNWLAQIREPLPIVDSSAESALLLVRNSLERRCGCTEPDKPQSELGKNNLYG